MLSLFAFLLILLAFFSFYLYKLWQYDKKLPPGPWGPSIFSYAALLKRNAKSFNILAEKYGQIFSVRVGTQLVVILNDYDAIRDTFIKQGDIFAGRPLMFTLTRGTQRKGVIGSDGEVWKILRRFTLASLRDFGMGKLSIEGKIHEETNHVIKKIKSYNGKPFDPRLLTMNAVSNIICSILFGNRFDYEDRDFEQLMILINERFTPDRRAFLLNLMPWLERFPPFKNVGLKFIENFEKYLNFIRKFMDEHKQSLDQSQAPKDFLAAMMHEALNNNDPKMAEIFHENLVYLVNNLFLAGTETTATTLLWSFLYLAKHPEVQQRIRQEIIDIFGTDKVPSYENRKYMPFTEATIMEIQRLGNITPTAIPHSVMEDTYVRGFLIPKSALIMPNMTNCHHDPKYWDNPEEFRPERFLDAAGVVQYRMPSFLPFSAGKRACLGETLAKMELFLFITGLLQKFTLEFDENSEQPSFEGRPGLTRGPYDYVMCFKPIKTF